MLKSLAIVISAISVIGPISHSAYTQTEKSTAYALLIDNTGSLDKRFDQVKLFSKRVVDQVHTRGPVQLFNFTWTRDASYFVIPNEVDRYEGGNYDRAIAKLGAYTGTVSVSDDAGSVIQLINQPSARSCACPVKS